MNSQHIPRFTLANIVLDGSAETYGHVQIDFDRIFELLECISPFEYVKSFCDMFRTYCSKNEFYYVTAADLWPLMQRIGLSGSNASVNPI